MEKLRKKINISYARYLKGKRADRFTGADEESFAQKHTRRVRNMKRFILRLVLLLCLLLIIWPLVNKNWGSEQISLQSDAEKKPAQTEQAVPVMLKPKLFGYDENNQPYNITADSSVSVSETKMVLSNINGEMSLKDSSRIRIYSQKGDYALKKKELTLNGGVKITTDKNYEFQTNSAFVKMKENTATGSEKVHITGTLGDIDANGFVIRNSGDELFLFGGVDLDAVIADEDFDKMEEFKKDESSDTKPGASVDLKSAFQPERGKPMNIVSDSLVIDNDDNLAVFTKNVHAKQGQMNLKADEMKLYTEYDDKTRKSQIKFIEANGNVDFQSTDKSVKSQKATYDVKSGVLILLNEVLLSDGINSLEGMYFKYNVKTGISEVKSTSNLVKGNDGDFIKAPKRVKAVFTPGDDNISMPITDKINNFALDAPPLGVGKSGVGAVNPEEELKRQQEAPDPMGQYKLQKDVPEDKPAEEKKEDKKN